MGMSERALSREISNQYQKPSTSDTFGFDEKNMRANFSALDRIPHRDRITIFSNFTPQQWHKSLQYCAQDPKARKFLLNYAHIAPSVESPLLPEPFAKFLEVAINDTKPGDLLSMRAASLALKHDRKIKAKQFTSRDSPTHIVGGIAELRIMSLNDYFQKYVNSGIPFDIKRATPIIIQALEVGKLAAQLNEETPLLLSTNVSKILGQVIDIRHKAHEGDLSALTFLWDIILESARRDDNIRDEIFLSDWLLKDAIPDTPESIYPQLHAEGGITLFGFDSTIKATYRALAEKGKKYEALAPKMREAFRLIHQNYPSSLSILINAALNGKRFCTGGEFASLAIPLMELSFEAFGYPKPKNIQDLVAAIQRTEHSDLLLIQTQFIYPKYGYFCVVGGHNYNPDDPSPKITSYISPVVVDAEGRKLPIVTYDGATRSTDYLARYMRKFEKYPDLESAMLSVKNVLGCELSSQNLSIINGFILAVEQTYIDGDDISADIREILSDLAAQFSQTNITPDFLPSIISLFHVFPPEDAPSLQDLQKACSKRAKADVFFSLEFLTSLRRLVGEHLESWGSQQLTSLSMSLAGRVENQLNSLPPLLAFFGLKKALPDMKEAEHLWRWLEDPTNEFAKRYKSLLAYAEEFLQESQKKLAIENSQDLILNIAMAWPALEITTKQEILRENGIFWRQLQNFAKRLAEKDYFDFAVNTFFPAVQNSAGAGRLLHFFLALPGIDSFGKAALLHEIFLAQGYPTAPDFINFEHLIEQPQTCIAVSADKRTLAARKVQNLPLDAVWPLPFTPDMSDVIETSVTPRRDIQEILNRALSPRSNLVTWLESRSPDLGDNLFYLTSKIPRLVNFLHYSYPLFYPETARVNDATYPRVQFYGIDDFRGKRIIRGNILFRPDHPQFSFSFPFEIRPEGFVAEELAKLISPEQFRYISIDVISRAIDEGYTLTRVIDRWNREAMGHLPRAAFRIKPKKRKLQNAAVYQNQDDTDKSADRIKQDDLKHVIDDVFAQVLAAYDGRTFSIKGRGMIVLETGEQWFGDEAIVQLAAQKGLRSDEYILQLMNETQAKYSRVRDGAKVDGIAIARLVRADQKSIDKLIADYFARQQIKDFPALHAELEETTSGRADIISMGRFKPFTPDELRRIELAEQSENLDRIDHYRLLPLPSDSTKLNHPGLSSVVRGLQRGIACYYIVLIERNEEGGIDMIPTYSTYVSPVLPPAGTIYPESSHHQRI